jgi:hypothetical protein
MDEMSQRSIVLALRPAIYARYTIAAPRRLDTKMIDGKTCWKRPRDRYFLPHDEVHVWRTSLHLPPEYVARLRDTLSLDERERADRFRLAADRMRNVIGRALSRILLGHCLAISPGSVKFDYGAAGKPRLAMNPRQTLLNFNVSHSGDFVLVALAYNWRMPVVALGGLA